MRVGIVTEVDVSNSVYRAFPLAELAALGHEVVVSQGVADSDRPHLFRCDVVHVYRLSDRPQRRLMRDLRAAGVALVYDVDDDLSALPETAPQRWARGAAREQQMLNEVLQVARLADIMTTTTETIAALYRGHGIVVRVVDNYIPRLYAPGAPRSHDGMVIGWVAANEHIHDLEQLRMRDVLTRVLEARPQTRVHGVGVNLGLPLDRYTHEDYVRYKDLGGRVAGFDIGIAPLDDIPFNRARSNVKLKEYAAAGVPWLASPIGPYAGLGEKQGGRLVADDGWEAALLRLVDKDRQRRKLAKRALDWGRTQSAAANVSEWKRVLDEAIDRARRRSSAPRGSSGVR